MERRRDGETWHRFHFYEDTSSIAQGSTLMTSFYLSRLPKGSSPTVACGLPASTHAFGGDAVQPLEPPIKMSSSR